MTQCFHHLFASPSPSVLSIFNADGFYLAPRWPSQEASAWIVCNMKKENESRTHKEVQKKDQLFCDAQRLFTQSWLDPRRGALNSQSGGIKIATLSKACGPKDWMCAGYLKLLLHFCTVLLPELSHDFPTTCTAWMSLLCVFLVRTGGKIHQICVHRCSVWQKQRVNISAADKR